MRLPYKVFVTSTLVIVALVGVAAWTLLAINRLVAVNRSLATEPLPALRMGTSLRERLGGLTRTEMDARRAAKNREPAQKQWNDRAAEMAKDSDRVRSFLATREGRGSRSPVRPPRDGAPPVGTAATGSER